ncbi:hypothetical protein CWG85_06510 [Salmonella enterica subsp. enterica serovar Adelaide]|nr:hypothetical protein [Salmonella enterica subsp. enterica serovar Kokomlemle]EDL5727697.1 hypothetical protein [Salmonella enterica subsp. enterica serovar Adelaide]
MSNKIVFVNGKSKCGCVMAFSDGGGEYSDVHTIIPCAEHSMPESALTQRIAELERSETQLINERDSAESALNDAYKAVMGQAPEWSNWFSFENAIDEIELACELWRNQTDDVIQFRQRIQELESKFEAADKLQDSAFRDGLKAGFSYGQTDDQSGYEQCLKSYSSRGKDNG